MKKDAVVLLWYYVINHWWENNDKEFEANNKIEEADGCGPTPDLDTCRIFFVKSQNFSYSWLHGKIEIWGINVLVVFQSELVEVFDVLDNIFYDLANLFVDKWCRSNEFPLGEKHIISF